MRSKSEHRAATIRVLQKNVQALVSARKHFERSKGVEAHVADTITSFIGSMKFVYLHAVAIALWLVLNVGWLGVEPFDPPPFTMLAMVCSVEAIFLSTFVLISQNRMQQLSDKRNELDLQISLVAEREITAILSMVRNIAERLDVPTGVDPQELADLQRVITPEAAMEQIERHEKSADR